MIAPPHTPYHCLTASMISEIQSSYGSTVDSPETVAKLLAPFALLEKEAFVVVSLNAKNGVESIEIVHIGTLTMSVVGPREVFRAAIRANASSIVVAHNHPSGDATPSPPDLEITARLVEIGLALDIPVHDHVILGHSSPSGFVSLKQRGLM